MLLILTLCACGAQTTWQEQYDLGAKYLDDGDYKEPSSPFKRLSGSIRSRRRLSRLADAYNRPGRYGERAAKPWKTATTPRANERLKEKLDGLAETADPAKSDRATSIHVFRSGGLGLSVGDERIRPEGPRRPFRHRGT